MHKNLGEQNLVYQDSFLFCAEDHGAKLTARKFGDLFRVPHNEHVLLESGRKLLQKVLINFLQLLEGNVFETQRPRFNDTTYVVFFHVERQNFNEFEHLRVEGVIVNFEVSGGHVDAAVLRVRLHREELLEDEVAEFEVGVRHLQPQLDIHIVILVVRQAETVSFKHFAVCHSPVAKINLRSFGERFIARLDNEVVVGRHQIHGAFPDCLRLVLVQREFLCASSCSNFALLCIASLLFVFLAHAVVAEHFLLNEQIKVVVTFEARRVVHSRVTLVLGLFLRLVFPQLLELL